MKNCPRCNQDKNELEFRKNKRSKDGLQKYCSECDKLYQKEWYKKNYDKVIDKSKISNIKLRKRNQDYVINYLKEHPCVVCGEDDIIVLEFDHLHSKLSGIANLISSTTIDNIQGEIDKCQVLCANCHKRKTAKDFNWYKAT